MSPHQEPRDPAVQGPVFLGDAIGNVTDGR